MEIELSDLINIISKKIWLIIFFTALSVAAAGWVSCKLIVPKYQATTTLLVQPQGASLTNYDSLVANEKLVPTYSAIVKSKKAAASVIASLKLDVTGEELLEAVDVTGVKGSMVIEIAVMHTKPDQAIAITNAFAESFKAMLPEILEVKKVATLDSPELSNSGKPVNPNPVLIMVIVFILALNTVTGFIIVFEILDKTVKTEKLLQKLLEIPVLACLPSYKGKTKKRRLELSCMEEPASAMSEAFRKLRTNMLYMKGVKEIHTLVVTSPLPKEGKTVTAANLAIALAQEGRQVLLVDGNLRNPSIHKLFGIPNDEGLVTAITGENSDLAVFPTPQENLHIFPGGPIPTNPSELLSSPKMNELLESLRELFDVIVFDSPPVLTVADTQVLSRSSDAVLLVTRLGVTLCESALQAKELLLHVGANLVGAVANNQRIRHKRNLPKTKNVREKPNTAVILPKQHSVFSTEEELEC